MTQYHGFELIKEQEVAELNTRARLFRHIRTGAELLSLENDDENKTFGVSFRTPPEDSTGLPHILEHTVLCGSRKYPVKEPLIELVKGSLQTFINAMTFADKTIYPIASTNLQDFYNMVDVYLDAVFYPLITEKHFQQEGWHFELDSLDDPLTLKGVVFNEMKGYYSSADIMMGQYTQQALFPDTPYANDSGGDPARIPDLTYEQFKNFHDTYYHPSNAQIFFYGDDDPEERLRLVDAFISDFDSLNVDSELPLQEPFPEPRRVIVPIEASEEDDNSRKGRVAVNWVMAESVDVETSVALHILSHVLVGTPASPLRKVLIDSGLGEDLVGNGTSSSLRQVIFSTGLKGIAPETAGQIEQLVLDTLQQLVDEGIESDMVEASLNTVEFELRENNTGSYPRGLALMIGALSGWNHGGDPIEQIAFEAPLNKIKGHYENNPHYFEKLIQQYMLDNPHRSTLVMEPDTTVRARRDAAEQARIDEALAAMTQADREKVAAVTAELKLMQETPDTPEALATIPSLHLDDLDPQAKVVPLEEQSMQGSTVLYHDLFTNGVTYLDVGFDLYTLPQALLPYMGLFGRVLLEMGTATEDFVKLSRRIGRTTGGIEPTNFTSANKQTREGAAWFFLRSKTMAGQESALLDILRDVLLTVNLDNQERFRQIVMEEKSNREMMFNFAGHMPALKRLRAHFAESFWANEQMEGVTYLFFLRDLLNRIDADWNSVLADLKVIRDTLINRGAMIANVTVDDHSYRNLQPQLDAFLHEMPASAVSRQQWDLSPLPVNEALTVPTQVHYVGKGANLYDLGYELHGSHVLILKYLNTTYMWEKVRIQGGAYGGSCIFDHATGVTAFVSWQDPNFIKTLDNYDGAAAFLRQVDLSKDELTRSIIGAIGQVDQYQLPDAKGYSSMLRYLIHYTDADRQRIREEIMATSMQDFRTLADSLEKIASAGHVVVTAAPDALAKVTSERPDWLTVTKVI